MLNDYNKISWNNNSSPYLEENNLQPNEDKVEELDKFAYHSKNFPFYSLDYFYANNVKTIEKFQHKENWTASGSTINNSSSTIIVGDTSLYMYSNTSDTNSSVVASWDNRDSIDLTTFNNGTSASDDDYIVCMTKILGIDTLNITGSGIYLRIGNDSSNYFEFKETIGLVEGYNLLYWQKSDYDSTLGSPTWDDIKYILVGCSRTQNSTSDFTYFILLQMIRYNASVAFSAFQRDINGTWQNYFENDQVFTICEDYNRLVIVPIGLDSIGITSDSNAFSLDEVPVKNIVSEAILQTKNSGGNIPIMYVFANSNNYARMYITSTLFYADCKSNGIYQSFSMSKTSNFEVNDIIKTRIVINGTQTDYYFENINKNRQFTYTTVSNYADGSYFASSIQTNATRPTNIISFIQNEIKEVPQAGFSKFANEVLTTPFEYGTDSSITATIAATSTFTAKITLSSNYNNGMAILKGYNNGGVTVYFNTREADAIGVGSDGLYRNQSSNGNLSGGVFSSGGNIILENVSISYDYLELEFYNPSGSSENLALNNLYWRVYK